MLVFPELPLRDEHPLREHSTNPPSGEEVLWAYSQENNLLNDYSAKIVLGLFGKTWWRFSSYSIVYRGR